VRGKNPMDEDGGVGHGAIDSAVPAGLLSWRDGHPALRYASCRANLRVVPLCSEITAATRSHVIEQAGSGVPSRHYPGSTEVWELIIVGGLRQATSGPVVKVAGGTPPPTFSPPIDFTPALKICRCKIVEGCPVERRRPGETSPTPLQKGNSHFDL